VICSPAGLFTQNYSALLLARDRLYGKELPTLDTLAVAHKIVDVLEEKKGEDILLLDIREVGSLADYFVICSGTSDRMLDALMDAVIRQLRKEDHLRAKVEGTPQDGWMLADYGDVIVHIFSPARRNYYRLEELWSEGKIVLHLQ
jgi:ribosome-associated protein